MTDPIITAATQRILETIDSQDLLGAAFDCMSTHAQKDLEYKISRVLEEIFFVTI